MSTSTEDQEKDERPASESQWKQVAATLRRRLNAYERSGMNRAVLRRLVPVRAAALPGRSAAPAARDREARFRAASASYARIVDDRAAMTEHTRVITLDGLTWWVPLTTPGDHESVERYMGHQDFPYRTLELTREVALGGIMLDLGGNVGRMSIPRVILGDVGLAYCAEPDPLNHACLSWNVRDNHLGGLVMPDQVAIGSEDGTARFARAKSPGGHKVLADGAASTREVLDVPSLTLDSWTARLGINLDEVTFVKMDVQGSEVAVLDGAARLLAHRHIAWQIEIDVQLLSERRHRASDLYDRLRRHFTHFIDLGSRAMGQRVRRSGEMEQALMYVSGGTDGRTDVLVFNLDEMVGH